LLQLKDSLENIKRSKQWIIMMKWKNKKNNNKRNRNKQYGNPKEIRLNK
jgi:hypothetical protein